MSDVTRLETLINNHPLLSQFNRGNQLVKLNNYKQLPKVDGSKLTNVLSTGSAVSYIAQANITIYTVVTSDGFTANSNIISQRNKIIGITNANTLTGFSGTAVGIGTITNPAWTWVIGDKIYLNDTSLSTIAPTTGYIQLIGTATGADTINVKLAQSMLL